MEFDRIVPNNGTAALKGLQGKTRLDGSKKDRGLAFVAFLPPTVLKHVRYARIGRVVIPNS